MYSYTLTHEGLGKYQVVRGRTEEEARYKAELKKAAWDAQYKRTLERNSRKQTAEDRRAEREAFKEEAAARTSEAELAVTELQDVLNAVVDASPVFTLDSLRAGEFSAPPPTQPKYRDYPREPKPEDWTFVPQFDFWDKLFRFRRNKKLKLGQLASQKDVLGRSR